MKQVNNKANDVNQETFEKWKRKISKLITRYKVKDVYNTDATDLFFKGIPIKSLVLKNESCARGKKTKNRLTVLIFCSIAEEIKKPLVISKFTISRCFKNMDISSLPVM